VSKSWYPNPLEIKCLAHLDSPGGWKILGRDMPPTTEVLPWSPFQRIFFINFTQFALILAVLFFFLEKGSGMSFSDIQDDLPYGLGIAGFLALVLGLYVMHLYRRSWNKRARSLSWRES